MLSKQRLPLKEHVNVANIGVFCWKVLYHFRMHAYMHPLRLNVQRKIKSPRFTLFLCELEKPLMKTGNIRWRTNKA